MVIERVLWIGLCAGYPIHLALHGQRDMWFLAIDVLFLAAWFVARWSGLRLRPWFLFAIVLLVEYMAVSAAFL